MVGATNRTFSGILFLGLLNVLGPTPARAAPFAYVAQYDGRSVLVIDVATNTVVTDIDGLDQGKGNSVVVSPDGSRAYVDSFNSSGDDIHVFDTATHTKIDSFPVSAILTRMAISPDGSRLYASAVYDKSIVVMDTTTGAIQNAAVHAEPTGLAVHPNGSRIYAGDYGGGVSVVDAGTLDEVADISLSSRTYAVAVHPDGTTLYAAGAAMVSVIDTATNTEIDTIDATNGYGAVVNHSGSRLYVTDHENDTVAVIDTSTNTVIDTIPVGAEPTALAVTPSDTRLYVACIGHDIVSVIETATNTVVANILTGPGPAGIAMTPAGHMAATPDFHNFGAVNAGTASATQQITVTNVGTASLEMNTVALSGDDAEDFEIVSNGCTHSLVLAPEATCTIDVRFTPLSGGTMSASIRLAFQTATADVYLVDLAGQGLGPTVTVFDPTLPIDDRAIDFGRVESNQTSDATIEIRNDGNLALVLGTIASADPLADPFSLAPGRDNCSGATVAPAEICDFTVRFAPVSTATSLDTFDIPSNAVETVTVDVEGVGARAAGVDILIWDEVQPAFDYLIPLGEELVGNTTWPVYLRTRNVGSVDSLEIQSVEITGEDAAEFRIVMVEDQYRAGYCGPTPPFMVQWGSGLCNMYPTFSPTSAGEKTATVEIVSNDPDEGLVVYTLTGTGLGPEIEVTDSMDPDDDLEVPFGEVEATVTSYAEIKVANTGNMDLAVTDITIGGDAEFVLDLSAGMMACGTAAFTLIPDHSCTVTVAFSPASPSETSATVTITSDDLDEATTVVALSGAGAPPEEPTGDGSGVDDGGCNCGPGGSSTPGLFVALLALLAVGVRRAR